MEYVIWGKSPNSLNINETLLLTCLEGKKIESKQVAYGLLNKLKYQYKCTDLRVQEIDFNDKKDLFINSVNIL
jgi:hypothetical protein